MLNHINNLLLNELIHLTDSSKYDF